MPFPGDDILETINGFFNIMFKPEKIVTVNNYSDYPLIPDIPYPQIGISGYSNEEKITNNKRSYKNKLETIFCYEYFQDDNYNIICYNQKYIKQNTNIFFPSILVFNSVPKKIKYEITSKHFPEIIKGELEVIEKV